MNNIESFYGFIESTSDALRIFELCRQGKLGRIRRRLHEKERIYIRSGSVFVFDEVESGIKRWTDGRLWSPSRIYGNFLIYRELETKIKNKNENETVMESIKNENNFLSSVNNGDLQTGNASHEHIIDNNGTTTINLEDSMMNSHLNESFYPIESEFDTQNNWIVDRSTILDNKFNSRFYPASSLSHTNSSSSSSTKINTNSSGSSSKSNSSQKDYGHLSQLEMNESHASILADLELYDSMLTPRSSENPNGGRKPRSSKTKPIFFYKENGLIKKTISITMDRHIHHLICYYNKRDFTLGHSSGSFPLYLHKELMKVKIPSDLILSQNFKLDSGQSFQHQLAVPSIYEDNNEPGGVSLDDGEELSAKMDRLEMHKKLGGLTKKRNYSQSNIVVPLNAEATVPLSSHSHNPSFNFTQGIQYVPIQDNINGIENGATIIPAFIPTAQMVGGIRDGNEMIMEQCINSENEAVMQMLPVDTKIPAPQGGYYIITKDPIPLSSDYLYGVNSMPFVQTVPIITTTTTAAPAPAPAPAIISGGMAAAPALRQSISSLNEDKTNDDHFNINKTIAIDSSPIEKKSKRRKYFVLLNQSQKRERCFSNDSTKPLPSNESEMIHLDQDLDYRPSPCYQIPMSTQMMTNGIENSMNFMATMSTNDRKNYMKESWTNAFGDIYAPISPDIHLDFHGKDELIRNAQEPDILDINSVIINNNNNNYIQTDNLQAIDLCSSLINEKEDCKYQEDLQSMCRLYYSSPELSLVSTSNSEHE